MFIPKYRRKTLYGELRRNLGVVIRKLAGQKGSHIEEGHLMPDRVHIMVSIPLKYAVSQVIGYIKGKVPFTLRERSSGKNESFVREHFWARGYFVSTVGSNEEVIRNYIRNQAAEDWRLNQQKLFK